MAKIIPPQLQTNQDKINRANEVRRDTDKTKNISVGLLEVDSALFYYFEHVIKPEIEEAGETVKVPLVYANAERWKSIRKDGYARDHKNKRLTPVIAFRRTSFAKDTNMPVDKLDPLNPKIHRTYQAQYTRENRYDKFSATQGIVPKNEYYSVAVPDYVTLSYDFIIWTNFTDQMNNIVEKINWSEGSYWGDESKFKFRATIDSFEDASEYETAIRNIKTNFSVTIYGYLLPETFSNITTTEKYYTKKKIMLNETAE